MSHFGKWFFEEETRSFSFRWQPQNESVLHRVLSQSHCPAAPHWRQVGTVLQQHIWLWLWRPTRRKQVVRSSSRGWFQSGRFWFVVEQKRPVASRLCPRYQIEEGLKLLHDVKPAGETYMHEGIKQVASVSCFHVGRNYFNNHLLVWHFKNKNVFIWRPRSRYGFRAPSPPASFWRWRTASWMFTFMNWRGRRWVQTKVSF